MTTATRYKYASCTRTWYWCSTAMLLTASRQCVYSTSRGRGPLHTAVLGCCQSSPSGSLSKGTQATLVGSPRDLQRCDPAEMGCCADYRRNCDGRSADGAAACVESG